MDHHRRLDGIFKSTLWLAVGLFALQTRAAVFSVVPSADTSLMEIAPTNNNGGQAWLLAGRIQNIQDDGYRNRALLKFDLTSLPTNALILSVALNLEVTRVPAETPAISTFGLRRMLRPWGEGNKVADGSTQQPPGQGRPASAGEATWLSAFFPTNDWSAPGAAEGTDYSATESSFQSVSGLGPYNFPSTPELVADVQDWVTHPALNHGWMLRNDEVAIFTARRFGSREDPDAHPVLNIEYSAPPVINSASHAGGQFVLTFTAWPGQACLVEFRDNLLAGPWQTLTNLGAATTPTLHTVTDSIAEPRRFYRVVGF